MSAAKELLGNDHDHNHNRSHQEMMIGLLKILVDLQVKQAESQATQAESHATTLHQVATTQHQVATTQHQMMEILTSSTTDEGKHKVAQNPSLSSRLNQPVPRFKRIYNQLYNEKMMHRQAYELVECMLSQLHKKMNRQKCDIDTVGQTMLQLAIAKRNEMIVDLICEASEDGISDLVDTNDIEGNTVLHYTAKLAPSDHLNTISGAYLQMQRELQWFKGVENMMLEKNKLKRNAKGDTAHHIFMEEHKELMEKGEKLLKDTSGSCMVVAALIATVAFAAAFTAPGGNVSDSNSTKNGTPVFLDKTSFTLFAVAGATALFSSVTSVLMFLAIYTSRYAEVDFLKSLPRKLIVGLVTLFISMATILVAFGASLYIVLGERFSWAAIPIALFSCVPLTLFASLQLPLFFEMVRSTYWSSPLQKHRYIPSQQFNTKKDS
ncbi:ankyrin repeat-containing protein NPR4-like [Papaver somniferum]|uniref:ankyrin repeat-containing protein NPR4-like n=1 Tax=Papaver somniferum TaxID=3469 RepID=UPI000E6FD179|nr:ankyrin repeat-containing protein NPR4-like [Papaver somniferum]